MTSNSPEFFRLIGRTNVFQVVRRYMAAEIIPSVHGVCDQGTTCARVADVEFCAQDGSPLTTDADRAIAAIEAGLIASGAIEAPARNSATYCDGKAREFTVRFPGAGVRGADLFAAVAGQTSSDPLDCVALTEDEAHAAGMAWARNRTIFSSAVYSVADYEAMFRVIPLPEGWSNDGRPAPVAMVAQPVQQAQCQALCAPHSHYNRTNFPRVIGQHGNWDICANADGYCAAIPNRRGEAFGCHATHFGDADYVRVTLGLEAMPVAMVPQPAQQQQACAARVRPPVNVHVEICAIRAGVMWRGLWLKMDELQEEHDRVHFERRARYAIISEMATVANLAREICELAGMDEAGLDAMLQDYSL